MTARNLKQRYWTARERAAELRQGYGPKAAVTAARAAIGLMRHATFELDGVTLRLGKHLTPRLGRKILSGEYEAAERRIVRQRLRPDDVVLEVGAGVGLLATLCAQIVGDSRVTTVEANPALEPVIRETFALNRVQPTLVTGLLGDGEGTESFFVEHHLWSSSTLRRSASAKEVKVARHDFGALLRRVRPTFLIMDIEGGELALLRGRQLDGVRGLAIELHERLIGKGNADAIRNDLARQGFRRDDAVSEGAEQLYFAR
jgi:FkbM family methyltransferase